MPNTYFQFKEFKVEMAKSGLKVTTDACLFGAWIAEELQKTNPTYFSALDIGTGTGLLSLMVVQKNPKASIHAVEKVALAAEEASMNFRNSAWRGQLSCLHQSIQKSSTDQKFDVILSNPPFFNNHFRGKNAGKNTALHDESLPMNELIKAVDNLMVPDGKFFVLYPEREMKLLEKTAAASSLHLNHQVEVRNKPAADVFRVMACFSRKKEQKKLSEIWIKNSKGKYTREFWELLSPYYLDYNNPLLFSKEIH